VGVGSKGCEGVANMVAQTPGAIGYVEYAYARQSQLTYTKLINAAGRAVTPDIPSITAAAEGVGAMHADGNDVLLVNQPGAGSWPIVWASFVLVRAAPEDVAETTEALKFFSWAYSHGAQMAVELDYAPLPESLIQSVRSTWTSQIKGVSQADLDPETHARRAGLTHIRSRAGTNVRN
jgi:phosphate transport system substrate-binding protein